MQKCENDRNNNKDQSKNNPNNKIYNHKTTKTHYLYRSTMHVNINQDLKISILIQNQFQNIKEEQK